MTLSLTTAIALAFLIGSGAFIALALLIARNRYPLGAPYMAAATLGVAVWYLGTVGEILASSTVAGVLFQDFRFLGVVVVAPSFFLFVLRYFTGRGSDPRLPVVLYGLAAINLLFVWTNPLHELMWPHPSMAGELRVALGPWFRYVHAPYAYLLLGAAMLLLTHEIVRPRIGRRVHAAILLGATLLPFLVNMIFVYNPSIPDLHLTPLAFGVTAVVGWAGFFRTRMFQLNPLALRKIFDSVGEAVVVADAAGHVADMNAFTGTLLDVSPHTLMGRPLHTVAAALTLPPAALEPQEGRYEVVTGRGIVLQLDISPVADRDGTLRGRVVVARDVTARRAAEDALRRSEELVRSIVEHSPNGIMRLRAVRGESGRIRDFLCVLANPSAARYLALPLDEVLDARLTEIDPPHAGLLFDFFRRVVETGRTEELELRTRGQHRELWFRLVGTPISGDVAVTFVNVSAQKERELLMEAAALHDPLTGVLNRRGFLQDADAVLAPAAEGSEARPFALLYVDLDDFKGVNDTYGHEAGDAVLAEFARRLKWSTRAQDLIGRVGGDEFVVLATDASETVARDLGARIDEAARTPFRVGERSLDLSCSVGIARLPADGDDADGGDSGRRRLEGLLRSGDEAMYRNKRARRAEGVQGA